METKAKKKVAQWKECTCWFLVEAIPLHFATAHITADKVSAVAQEDSVADCVNVGRREVCNASIASVFAVCWLPVAHQLLPDL